MAGKKPKNYTEEVHLRITKEMHASITEVMNTEECGRPEAVRKLLRYGIQRFNKLKELEEKSLESDYLDSKGGTESETQAG